MGNFWAIQLQQNILHIKKIKEDILKIDQNSNIIYLLYSHMK